MLDVEASFRPAPDAPDQALSSLAVTQTDGTTDRPDPDPFDALSLRGMSRQDGEEDVAQDAIDSRPITPRRPLRFTSARAVADIPAIALTVPNIFDGVFDTEDTLIDPRLQRSRARAHALLAARAAALSDCERNLWHNDDLLPAPPVELAPREPSRSGRRVRHLTAADLSARRHGSAGETRDQLRDRLTDIRSAIYAPDPEDAAQPTRPVSGPLPNRLTAQVLNVTLLTVALPVGATVATITLLRGEDLAFSARAVALVGAITGFLQLAPMPHI